jgi:hypothetical protein
MMADVVFDASSTVSLSTFGLLVDISEGATDEESELCLLEDSSCNR